MLETPYFLLDLQKLENNLHNMQKAFRAVWPKFEIGYSFKTNNLPWIASWMKAQGVYAEVVSTPEYELAKYVGYDDNQIIINGPNKGHTAITNILKAGGIVNIDSFEEIKFVQDNISELGSIKIGIRINFDLEAACPGETIPGKEPGRFGFNVENGDYAKAIELLQSIPGVSVVGLHGHHSTRTKSLKLFHAITTQICECAKQIPNLEYVDLGGCLFGDKPGAPTFEQYAATIVSVLEKYGISHNVTLFMEPGAALIASPISYVCKVIGTKDIKGTRLVFTDGSVKQIAPQMNTIKFLSTMNTKKDNKIPRQVVSGYSCIEMDRFLELKDANELTIGDEITILNTGAYSMVLSPLFIEYFPSVIVKDGDNYMVAREKWGTNEFVQKNNLYK